MRGLLLAAGTGSRLRPITNHIPKCLVEIHKKPLLDYWFNLLFSSEFDGVLVNTHYLNHLVENHINKSCYRSKVEIVYEKELLGTGGTILKNKNFFLNQSFFVAHADNLSSFNVEDFIRKHFTRPKGVDITMMTFESDSPHNCGIVELDNNGIVIGFHEKKKNPPSNLANGAVYIFEPSIINFLTALNKETIDLSTELLPFYMGKIQTFHNSIYHRDIGTPESLERANQEFTNL